MPSPLGIPYSSLVNANLGIAFLVSPKCKNLELSNKYFDEAIQSIDIDTNLSIENTVYIYNNAGVSYQETNNNKSVEYFNLALKTLDDYFDFYGSKDFADIKNAIKDNDNNSS